MVADWFSGREIVWAMAIFVNSWPFGNGLALVTLPTIASRWTVAAAFHVGAAAAAVGAAATALFYPSPEASAGRRDPAVLIDLSRSELGRVTLAAMPWMLYNVGYAVMLGFVPAFLVSHGFAVERAGVLLGVALALFVGSVQVGGAASQWLARPEGVVMLGLLPFGVALSVLPYVSPLPSLIVIGLLAGLPAATLVAAPTEVLSRGSLAAGMGLFYTWYYAGMALLPSVAGWLQDVVGGAAAIEFAAAAIFMTLVLYLAFRGAVARQA
jgi:hypothetical protein